MSTEKKPLIILTGPTAVGKTELSISLAKEVNGEIISADSMQVYKKMDIGTAKIMPEEMNGVPHHLIDILDPKEDFNVFLFQKHAKDAMNKIYENGRIPIIVGGTGFYIQSILYDIAFDENEEQSRYRDELNAFYEEYGADKLHDKLREIDPKSAEVIHKNNVKRVIRAIEFFKENGYPISKHNVEQRSKESPYNFAYFVLNHDRNILYDRIEKRIDIMVKQGLVDEVKGLLDYGCKPDMVSMQGLGYKEIVPYINGSCSLEDAVYILKRDTRHFAKRQLTWFRRERDVIWVDKSILTSTESQLDFIKEELGKRNSFL
ncbi:MAG: tRNA (adenosine(37)-N6)-dimethylallyltransferase MiaA [Lachnospiraceae bacterium]|nr:tRNA (adenosine(37)-N6)-dimethylallyltransferase MiaA [Lachnospiraceae bacterium]